jgi:hypothetical protein
MEIVPLYCMVRNESLNIIYVIFSAMVKKAYIFCAKETEVEVHSLWSEVTDDFVTD